MIRTTIEDAKATIITFDLPRGLLVRGKDGDADVLYNKATIREMSGYEEDIIANEKMTFTHRMHALVGNCLLSLSDGGSNEITSSKILLKATDDLLMSDLLVCVFKIREVTVGSEVRQKVTCPECTTDEGKPFIWTAILNLSEFGGIPVEGDPYEDTREFTTSRGTKIRWKMMTGAMEKNTEKTKNPSKAATLALLNRVISVNDEDASVSLLQSLFSVERQEIRDAFDVEGGIETDFECVCRNCGSEFKTQLEIGGAGFFFRSAHSEN